MFSHEELSTVIHSLVTGMPNRAVRLAYEAPDLEDDQREALMLLLAEPRPAHVVVESLGDALREMGAARDLVNECYRASFYASDRATDLSGNPLFAHFLAKKGGLVLDKWPHYFGIYARHLSRFRNRPCRVLEIGVYRGGGLDLLRHYLGPEAILVGVDIDPVAVKVASERHVVELGDQTDAAFLAGIIERHGPFDVVIDDGGHTMEQQLASATALLPLMAAGSVYIVEDTHTSYWPEYGGGRGVEGTFMEWVKGLLDELHQYHWSTPEPPTPWACIDAVHVHDSITVLDVGRPFAPFSEVVGTWDFLKLSRPLSAIHSELLATRDVALLERDEAISAAGGAYAQAEIAREAAQVARAEAAMEADRVRAEAAMEAEKARAEADAARAEANRAELAQRQAWEQLDQLRGSRSWRITGPLRRLRRARE